MNNKHQFPAQVTRIYDVPANCNSVTETETEGEEQDSTFSIVDSAEMELFPLMSPAVTDHAAVLYIEKGEVTLVLGMKTYKLTKGMLLYKIPEVTIQLLRFSEDCHFKVFSFAPQFEVAAGMPVTHLETITGMAANDPVLMPDTLTAATVTVLFWLLQKKVNWEEVQSPDETLQHIFSLLMLEMVSAFKRNSADNPCRS